MESCGHTSSFLSAWSHFRRLCSLSLSLDPLCPFISCSLCWHCVDSGDEGCCCCRKKASFEDSAFLRRWRRRWTSNWKGERERGQQRQKRDQRNCVHSKGRSWTTRLIRFRKRDEKIYEITHPLSIDDGLFKGFCFCPVWMRRLHGFPDFFWIWAEASSSESLLAIIPFSTSHSLSVCSALDRRRGSRGLRRGHSEKHDKRFFPLSLSSDRRTVQTGFPLWNQI